eukprot:GEMP01016021.1.p1 GENE.GEMP01016021.1~~GEMP01016021.1.p1  ORF type:complete len:407 (+),score=109.89 GEMP01016021.1:212-1432(+)
MAATTICVRYLSGDDVRLPTYPCTTIAHIKSTIARLHHRFAAEVITLTSNAVELTDFSAPVPSDIFVVLANSDALDNAALRLSIRLHADAGDVAGTVRTQCALNARGDVHGLENALAQACADDRVSAVQTLIEAMASVQWKDRLEAAGSSALHFCTSLQCAFIVLSSGAFYDHRDAREYTPLMHAAARNNVNVCTMLIYCRAQVNHAAETRDTALTLAAAAGSLQCVELLLRNKADASSQAMYGQTALLMATRWGKHDVVDLLLSRGALGVDVNAANLFGRTALMEASYQGAEAMVRLLLERKAAVNWANTHGNTALLLCAGGTGASSAVCNVLLVHKARVDHVNKDGTTALMDSASTGNVDVVAQLIIAGADVHRKSIAGKTATQVAVNSGEMQASEMLRLASGE